MKEALNHYRRKTVYSHFIKKSFLVKKSLQVKGYSLQEVIMIMKELMKKLMIYSQGNSHPFYRESHTYTIGSIRRPERLELANMPKLQELANLPKLQELANMAD